MMPFEGSSEAGAGTEAAGRHTISVVVPTYNRRELVGRAIGSILRQTYRPAEIIVVDDCSSDGTQEAIAEYAGNVPLVHIRFDRNRGGAVARNAGILQAKSEYVAFLDSDDEWEPAHLFGLINAAGHLAGDFAVASSALRISENPRVLPGREYPRHGSVAVKVQFVLSAALAFQTSTLLMPRETARRFMFDQSLRRHQDWDLICRMIENDAAMVLLSEATTKYYAPERGDAANVGVSRSSLPSLRFLVKHQGRMNAKTRARFVVLQIMRRRGIGAGTFGYLVYALMLGGIGIKEYIYYTREALGQLRLSRQQQLSRQ